MEARRCFKAELRNYGAMELRRCGAMTQEDRWQNNYDEVMRFVKTNRRNLSKYEMTERRLYTWVKHNRKVMNAGKMRPERVAAC